MEITLKGVSVKLTADEIISALLSDEGKGLWELKQKLNHLEAEIMEVDFEETGEQISAKIMPEIKDLLQSDTELPPPQKERRKSKKKHLGRKKKTINPVTGKRYYHPRKKKQIADPLESIKFESNIPCSVTGKKYRSAENNPFL